MIARTAPARSWPDRAAGVATDMDQLARAAGLASFAELWQKTLTRIEAGADSELARLRREPLTPLEYLTDGGYYHYGLALSPDWRWLATTWDRPDETNVVLRFRIDGDSLAGAGRRGRALDGVSEQLLGVGTFPGVR